MDCWHCRRNAVGACRFCGRGVCEDHAETQPFVLELFRGKDVTKALVVEDALWCKVCTPAGAGRLIAGCDVRHTRDGVRVTRNGVTNVTRGT